MLKTQKVKIFLSILVVVLIIVPATVFVVIRDYTKSVVDEKEVVLEDNSVKGVDVATVPYIVSLAPIRAKIGEEYVYVPSYFDSDTDVNDLTLTLVSAPSWLSLSNGVIRGVVPEVVVGSTFKFVIEVSDGYNSTSQLSYIVIE